MVQYINEKFWRSALSNPDWYVILGDDFKQLEEIAAQHKNEVEHRQIKREAYILVEKAVNEGRIPLASQGDNLDIERKPIDSVVIHHTKNPSGISLERLNAMQLLRIYGRYFANPTNNREKHLKGQPVWSGHFYKGQQVFWAYHWLVREDGRCEQILKDSYVGWHAGNWDINTRSVGICIDDDLTEKEPRDNIINSVAELIRSHYKNVPIERIFGHCEVNRQTECPGSLFHKVWKQKLLLHMR
jgi:hypothetical protein